jgi:CMP-N-acetylneuraminic acid synthetase
MIALIPARISSKGVPEKNIRTLNGKPLLWYVIQNAKKVADKVVVLSDGLNVLEYAKNEGCDTFHNELQSQDDCTIDQLLELIIKDLDDDFIVLQPTSPTLSVSSILKCYDLWCDGYDSVATVVDDAHIRVGDPQINRQQMQEKLKYTGGCVVCSRESFLKTNSRVGGKHGTVKIPPSEAIDMDTLEDFLLAEAMLNQLKITIVYDQSKEIGSGHYRRALLLQKLFTGHQVRLIHRDKITQLDFNADILIWDILDIETEPLNPHHAFTVTFENLGQWAGDLCINGIYSQTIPNAGFYSGRYWMTINDDFILKNCYKPDGKVIVAFGGTDPLNKSSNYDPSKYDVYTGNRPISWENTKYVICGAGNVAIEATARQLPIVVLPQNEREKLHEVNYFWNVNKNPDEPCWNELHERAKMYDFSCNNHRIKNLIIAKYNEWRLRK